MVKNTKSLSALFLSSFVIMTGISGSVLSSEKNCDDLEATRKLAFLLDSEKKHEASALEFRRLALLSDKAEESFSYYWAAAYQYLKADNPKMALKMLDSAESMALSDSEKIMLLRGETALALRRPSEAEYFWETLIGSNSDKDLKTYASVRLAKALTAQRKTEQAISSLKMADRPMEKEITAVETYSKGRDKKPWLGGLLGIVPGLGHVYSGEYANGARAFILNALFIYGMIETAKAEEWGGFAVISFFEITWYSGSIYGGVDAAHRFNRNRLNECLKTLDEGAKFEPNLEMLPAISLKYEF